MKRFYFTSRICSFIILLSVMVNMYSVVYAEHSAREQNVLFYSGFEDGEEEWTSLSAFDTTEKHSGERSAKPENGTTVTMSDKLALNSEKIYRFSAYVKGNGDYTPYVFYYDSDKNLIKNMPWNGTSDKGIGLGKKQGNRTDWKEETVNITSGTIEQYSPKYFSVGFRVAAAEGSMYVDDVSVEEIDASMVGVDFKENYVPNPTIDMPAFWKGSNWSFDETENHTYPSSAKMDATAGTDAVIRSNDQYTVYNPQNAYEISCWLKSAQNGNIVEIGALTTNGQGGAAARAGKYAGVRSVTVTDEWKEYKGIIYLADDSERSAHNFITPQICCSDSGAKTGYVYIDDISIKQVAYPDSIALGGADEINLINLSGDALLEEYTATATKNGTEIGAKLVWSVSSPYPELISISQSGVLAIAAETPPETEAVISVTLPEHYPQTVKAEKRVSIIYTVSEEYKEQLQTLLKSGSVDDIVSFLDAPQNKNALIQLGVDLSGYTDEILEADDKKMIAGLVKNAVTETAALEDSIKLLNEKIFVQLVNASTPAELGRILDDYTVTMKLGLEENEFYKMLSAEDVSVAKTSALAKILEDIPYSDKEKVKSVASEKVTVAYFSYITAGQIEAALAKISTEIGLDKTAEYEKYTKMSATNSDKISINKAMVREYAASGEIYGEFMKAYKAAVSYDENISSGGGASSGGGGSIGGSKFEVVYKENEKIDELTEAPELSPGELQNSQKAFTDLENVQWAAETIAALADKGIVNGYDDGSFRPNNKVTREEFLKMLLCAAQISDENAECDFADVDKNEWYYSFVSTAYKMGITQGTGDDIFGIGRNISREEMAAFAMRALNAKGALPNVESEEELFKDHNQISDFAKDAVYKMKALKIIKGFPDGRYVPEGEATRAEAAMVIYALHTFK